MDEILAFGIKFMPDNGKCPDAWVFKKLSRIEEFPVPLESSISTAINENYYDVSRLLFDDDYNNERLAIINSAQIGGGVAPDGLGIVSDGFLVYDSKNPIHSGRDRFIGANIGYLKFDNDRENAIYIVASGLAHSSIFPLTVTGDSGVDTVFLDSCLSWSKPTTVSAKHGLPDLWRFKVNDSSGDVRIVQIQKDIELRILPRSKILRWALKSELPRLAKYTIPKRKKRTQVIREPKEADTKSVAVSTDSLGLNLLSAQEDGCPAGKKLSLLQTYIT